MKNKYSLQTVGIQTWAIFWTILALIPFCLVFLLALRDNIDMYRDGLGLTGEIRWSNYAEAWNGASGAVGMGTYFQNSLIAASVALVIGLGVGVTAGYFSTHLSKKWRERYLQMFISMQVVPQVLLLIPYYQGYNALGLLNSPVALGVAYGVLTLPTTILIMQSFYTDFPKELIEAATLDGAGPYRTFFNHVIPLSVGPIISVAMLSLVFVWGETQFGLIILQDSRAQTVPVGLLAFQGQWTTNLGALFAGLAIASYPIIALYLVFSRRLIDGVATGGMGGR